MYAIRYVFPDTGPYYLHFNEAKSWAQWADTPSEATAFENVGSLLKAASMLGAGSFFNGTLGDYQIIAVIPEPTVVVIPEPTVVVVAA